MVVVVLLFWSCCCIGRGDNGSCSSDCWLSFVWPKVSFWVTVVVVVVLVAIVGGADVVE